MYVGGIIIIIITQIDISIVISHVSFSFTFHFFVENYCRNVDRPELCQISLYDFQKFLQMDQKVLRKFTVCQHNTEPLKKQNKTALCSLLSPGHVRSPGPLISVVSENS